MLTTKATAAQHTQGYNIHLLNSLFPHSMVELELAFCKTCNKIFYQSVIIMQTIWIQITEFLYEPSLLLSNSNLEADRIQKKNGGYIS